MAGLEGRCPVPRVTQTESWTKPQDSCRHAQGAGTQGQDPWRGPREPQAGMRRLSPPPCRHQTVTAGAGARPCPRHCEETYHALCKSLFAPTAQHRIEAQIPAWGTCANSSHHWKNTSPRSTPSTEGSRKPIHGLCPACCLEAVHQSPSSLPPLAQKQ